MHLTQVVTQGEQLWLATYRQSFLNLYCIFVTPEPSTYILMEMSYFPVSIASLIKFDVIVSSNPILVNRDVMLDRCRVDVGSV